MHKSSAGGIRSRRPNQAPPNVTPLAASRKSEPAIGRKSSAFRLRSFRRGGNGLGIFNGGGRGRADAGTTLTSGGLPRISCTSFLKNPGMTNLKSEQGTAAPTSKRRPRSFTEAPAQVLWPGTTLPQSLCEKGTGTVAGTARKGASHNGACPLFAQTLSRATIPVPGPKEQRPWGSMLRPTSTAADHRSMMVSDAARPLSVP